MVSMCRDIHPRGAFVRRMLTWLAVLVAATPAQGIPAFARRYQTSCTTCHVLMPRLNAFGTAFRNNGYRIPPNEARIVKVPDVSLGAPARKQAWPETIWPGAIAAVAPVALRIFSDIQVNPGEPAAMNFDFPREFELLAGGTAGAGISYFAELEVAPGAEVGNDRVNLERMFVQFDRIGGTSLANLTVGRFEIRAVAFSRYHRRLTASDLLAMDFRSPADGLHLRRPQAGLEFWGARSGRKGRGGFEYATGVVNGTGPLPDHNTAKDVYSRVAWKIGGFGVAGSTAESDSAPPWDGRRDDSVRIGLSSYLGTGRFADGRDRFWRVAGDIDAFLGALNLSAVAIHGEDRFASGAVVTRYAAMSMEADYVVKPWIVAITRYERVWRETGPDIHRVVPALVLAIRANVRAVAEWQAFLETSHAGIRAPSGDRQGVLRLDIAF